MIRVAVAALVVAALAACAHTPDLPLRPEPGTEVFVARDDRPRQIDGYFVSAGLQLYGAD